MSTALATRRRLSERFKNEPVYHIEKVQGCLTLLPFQKRICESLAKYERTVVRSCHDVGKTFVAAKAVLWFTSTFKNSKVITTAPTFKQVRMLLWAEIRAGYHNSKIPLGGKMMLTEWKIDDNHFAFGFTASPGKGDGEEQGQASSAQGFHAPHILVVFDEATGVDRNIWNQMEGVMTSSSVKFLAIGNPTTKDCAFSECFSDPGYNCIHLSCFDSPNFPANGFTSKADLVAEVHRLKAMTRTEQTDALESYKVVDRHLMSVRWAMKMILKHGMSHPLVVSKVFGEFPESDEHTLITLGAIQTACNRLEAYEFHNSQRVAIGVDVARFGSDTSVLTVLQGDGQKGRKTLAKKDTQEVAGEVIRLVKSMPLCRDIVIVVDGTGIGSGVVDALNAAKRDKILPKWVTVIEANFGDLANPRCENPKEDQYCQEYVNFKARIFVELSEDLTTELCIDDPDEVYADELPTIRYSFDGKGRWMIESKDDYKKRTGRGSPDNSDSLALANYGRKWGRSSKKFTERTEKVKIKPIVTFGKGSKVW